MLENSETLELGRISKRDLRTNLFPVSSVGRLLDLEFLLSDREYEGVRERVFEFISLDRNLIFALPSPRILSVPYRSTGILTPTLRALHDPLATLTEALDDVGHDTLTGPTNVGEMLPFGRCCGSCALTSIG